ncbi:receptor [Betaproteobacteria bacterium GR16-43]|nr:receptor [Betaproteobacteria bacterium GR16-43]
MNRALLILFSVLSVFSSFCFSQGKFPSKPVTIVVPYPPGGSNDTFARALGRKLTETWGQPILIENKGGAGGSIGAAYLTKQPADGYTLILMSNSFTTNAAIQPNLPFDPVKDFAPITMVARGPMILAVSNKMPAKTIAELIALAKSQPGKLNFGSSGAGSTNQFATELWMTAAGVQMTHVPYKGMNPAVTDLIGGHVDVLFASLPSVYAQTKSGKARALGVTSLVPFAAAPELPALAQNGAPGFEFDNWWGVWAPPGTSAEIISKIRADLQKILATPEMKEIFLREGADSVQMSTADFSRTVSSEIDQWKRVAAKAGIKPD